jgi:catechol 2,3-dioxygenase-like lactoylglutathione lyase family enzyme
MRFYCGAGRDRTHHHDLALVENPNLPPPPAEWSMSGLPIAINHIGITYPSREAWLRQLAYLQAKGVKFDRRIEHGVTHSLYIHDPNGYGVETPRETGSIFPTSIRKATAASSASFEPYEYVTENEQ